MKPKKESAAGRRRDRRIASHWQVPEDEKSIQAVHVSPEYCRLARALRKQTGCHLVAELRHRLIRKKMRLTKECCKYNDRAGLALDPARLRPRRSSTSRLSNGRKSAPHNGPCMTSKMPTQPAQRLLSSDSRPHDVPRPRNVQYNFSAYRPRCKSIWGLSMRLRRPRRRRHLPHQRHHHRRNAQANRDDQERVRISLHLRLTPRERPKFFKRHRLTM